MKLPTDKKERIKVIVLIAIGAIAVIWGLVVVVLKPYRTRKSEKAAAIKDFHERLEKGHRKITTMMRGRLKNAEILREIVQTSTVSNFVLRPRLGNYLLGATELIERYAARANVPIESIDEVGTMQIPKPKNRPTGNIFDSYGISVDLECRLCDLIRLLKAIEQENPYMCVTGLTIAGQPNKSGKHSIGFGVQWPVWADPETPDRLKEQLEKARKFEREQQKKRPPRRGPPPLKPKGAAK